MIEPIENMPAGTIGFRVIGHVTGAEYRDVLVPALRGQAESGEIRIVYAIGPEFEKFEAGALLEDTKTGVTLGFGHHSDWKRCALVTDVDWIVKAFHAFAWMAPGEVRTFGLDQLDKAKEWVAG
jgi:hypothetical protein